MSQKLFRAQALEYATEHGLGSPIRLKAVSAVALGLFCLALLVAGATFAATAKFAKTENARGWLVPSDGLVRIQASAGGVIETLDIAEGDAVQRGSVIATFSNGAGLGERSGAEVIAEAVQGEALATAKGAVASMEDLEIQLSATRRRAGSLTQEIHEVREQIVLAEQMEGIAREELVRIERLVDQGFYPRAQVDEKRRAAISAQASVGSQKQRLITLERQHSETLDEIRTLAVSRTSMAASTARDAAALDQRLATAMMQRQSSVRAPIAGHVNVLLYSVGQTVQPGATVALMTPDDSPLIAELYIPSNAIGYVRNGQVVRLKYDAFPYLRHGTYTGRVISVGSAPLSASEVRLIGFDFSEPVYRARVKIDSQEVLAYGESRPLRAGMLLNAELVTDRATLAQWLIDPIRAVSRR